MKVSPRCKNVGVTSQCQRRQKSAIGSAPEPNPLRIDGCLAQKKPGPGHNVFILGGPSPTRVLGLPESAAIHDSQSIIYREHDVPLAGQVLIHRVGVVVVVHVVEAEHHLPHRSTMSEDQSRAGLVSSWRDEQLAVNL